jgi:uncharacterized protein YbgA (DUF1722 family)
MATDLEKDEFEKVIDRYRNGVYRLTVYTLKLIDTLQFYANPDNYATGDNYFLSEVESDAGRRARDILKERL